MTINEQDICVAVQILTSGKPAIFPTDTVYGLGVAVGLAESPNILYDIKQRDFGKPVAWLVQGVEDLALYGKDVPELAFTLARTFWPGPLTLIVKAGDKVPESFQAHNNTIALRMPKDEVALALIEQVQVPLATTSANISGQKPPQAFADVDNSLLTQVDAALEGDGEKSGIASTVIDCTTGHPILIREGALSISDIQARL